MALAVTVYQLGPCLRLVIDRPSNPVGPTAGQKTGEQHAQSTWRDLAMAQLISLFVSPLGEAIAQLAAGWLRKRK